MKISSIFIITATANNIALQSDPIIFLIRNVVGSDKAGDDFKDDFTKVENLDQAIAEIERLRKDGEKLQGDLTGMKIMVILVYWIKDPSKESEQRGAGNPGSYPVTFGEIYGGIPKIFWE